MHKPSKHRTGPVGATLLALRKLFFGHFRLKRSEGSLVVTFAETLMSAAPEVNKGRRPRKGVSGSDAAAAVQSVPVDASLKLELAELDIVLGARPAARAGMRHLDRVRSVMLKHGQKGLNAFSLSQLMRAKLQLDLLQTHDASSALRSLGARLDAAILALEAAGGSVGAADALNSDFHSDARPEVTEGPASAFADFQQLFIGTVSTTELAKSAPSSVPPSAERLAA